MKIKMTAICSGVYCLCFVIHHRTVSAMTIVGGIFLVMSFVFPRTGIVLPGNSWPFDPAWVTVIICGIPLLYLAVWRGIYNKGISKISSALLISIAMICAIAIGDLFAAGEAVFIMEIGVR